MAVIPSLDPNDVILAHMSKDEIKDLSRAQGGYEINEYLNIPQFYRLGEVLQIPKIRDSIKTAYEGYKKTPVSERESVREGIDNLNEDKTGKELPLPDARMHPAPEVKELAKNGVQGDTQIVALSQPVYDFFKETMGRVDKNPNDGLPQFGLGSFLCSLIGGVVGTFIAPGLGTAIGAGLGNLGGSYVDDAIDPNSPDAQRSFLERLPAAALAGGLGYLGGQAYGGFNSGGMSGAWDALKNTASDISPYLIGASQMTGLTDEQRRKEINDEKNRKANESFAEKRDRLMQEFNDRYTGQRDFRTGQLLRSKHAEGGTVRHMKPISKTMYLDGEEGGQDDGIYTVLPHGSYVLDATTVSDLGDGNSKAGARKFTQHIENLSHIPTSNNLNNSPKVKVALSAGEIPVMPSDVAKFGNGNLESGHKALDNFIKALRLDKQHSHDSIPGKARDIHEYFKGGRV